MSEMTSWAYASEVSGQKLGTTCRVLVFGLGSGWNRGWSSRPTRPHANTHSGRASIGTSRTPTPYVH